MTSAASDNVTARCQEIAERRRALVTTWPNAWRDMLARWRADGPDAVWLMFSANYLLRTAGRRWAVDPVTLRNRVSEAAPVAVDELASLELVLLTHNHADHVDRELLRQLAAMDAIQWIVPRHMLPVAEACGIRAARIIVPEPRRPVVFGPLRVTAFDGFHWQYPHPQRWGDGEPLAGIEATGYLVEWPGHRALFPGDTRTYDPAATPTLGRVETLFAHVWLGREMALETDPPLLEAMSNFMAKMAPRRRVLLTHLWEVSRSPMDYWNIDHARRVQALLEKQLPGVEMLIPDFWSEIPL